MRRYLAQAEAASEAKLLLALETLMAVLPEMRYQSSPRTLLESALIRICRPEDAHSLLDLEARVAALEARVSHTATIPAPPPRPAESPAPAAKSTATEQAAKPPIQTVTAAEPAGPDPRPTNAPEQAEPPAAQTAKAPEDSPPASGDAAALWQAVLTDVQQSNIMVYLMAQTGTALSLHEDTLTIGFPDTNESQFLSVSAAINQNALQAALQARQPGLTLRLIKTKIEPASDEVSARAREVFGDTLVIE
jgi:DNA polymerase III gamma/tau subunit